MISTSPDPTKSDIEFRVYAIATALISTLYAAIMTIYPAMHDDAWYVVNSTGQPGSWEYFITTVANCVDHWNFDTGRLANMVTAPFLALFPRWVAGIFTGALIWWLYLLGPKISGCRYASAGAALWVAVVTFLFPWFNYMFLIVYASNYVWSSVMALTLTWILFRRPRCPLWVVAPLAYFTGWMHEGISVPLMVGLCVFCAIIYMANPSSRRSLPSRPMIAAIICLALGILTLMAMPAFRHQVGVRPNHLIKTVLWETLLNAIAYNITFYAYLIFVAVALLKRSVRRRMLAAGPACSGKSLRAFPLAICLGTLALGLTGTAMYLRFYAGPRMGIINMLFCTLAAVYLIRNCFSLPAWIGSARFRWIATSAMLLAAAVNLAAAVGVQVKLSKEYADVQTLLSRNAPDDYVVFYDRTPMHFGIDLLKPSYAALNICSIMGNLKILPARLKDFDPASPELQPLADGLSLYRNCLLIKRKESHMAEYITLQIEDSLGNVVDSRAKVHEFKDIKGESWCYLGAYIQTLRPDLQIRSARLTPTR